MGSVSIMSMLEYFRHAVCTGAEVEEAAPHPAAVRLLGDASAGAPGRERRRPTHFAWVHDGTLGRRDEPVPPMEAQTTARFGHSRYRKPMPRTVDIEFHSESGAGRRLWMAASSIVAQTCRAFWFVSRDDDLERADAPYLAFQQIILDDDEPVDASGEGSEGLRRVMGRVDAFVPRMRSS